MQCHFRSGMKMAKIHPNIILKTNRKLNKYINRNSDTERRQKNIRAHLKRERLLEETHK